MDIRLVATVINTPDPDELASFYERLLGLPRVMDEGDWVVVRGGPDAHALSFQRDHDYLRPVWPDEPGRPRAAVHLDITVDALEPATAHAEECGARRAAVQYHESARERVMIDPHGNPFCLIERTSG